MASSFIVLYIYLPYLRLPRETRGRVADVHADSVAN